ncbi:MAG TPA: serine/threonine-protein kinase [Haliangium sp.]|nr:serine/threonine-protein kinase [Haliangium sp.]
MLRRIGQGDLAEVFVAVRAASDEDVAPPVAPDLRPGSLVAVKRIWREMTGYPEVHQLLAEEGVLAAELRHPNVARVFDVGAVGGRPYIAMEYVPGADLAHLIERARPGKLAPGCAIRIGLDVCAALTHVHEARARDGRTWHVVHGDVTPTNILVSTSGVAKLIDFSVAVLRDAAAERAEVVPRGDDDVAQGSKVRGTYAYMSPEQVRGEPIDQRTDVFALGVVLWEVLSGQRLFRRQANYLTLAAVVEDEAPALASLGGELGAATPALDRILARALAKRREDRHARIGELAAELADVAERAGWDTRAWTLQTRVRQLLSELSIERV